MADASPPTGPRPLTSPAALTAGAQARLAGNLPRYYLYAFVRSFFIWLPIWIAFVLDEHRLAFATFAFLEIGYRLGIAGLEVPTGAIADRWGRGVSMALGAFTLGIALLLLVVGQGLAWVAASFALWAFADTLQSGADSALLYDTLKALGRDHEFERHAGRGQAASWTALLLAALISGPLADALSLETVIVIGAGISALAGVIALTLAEPPRLDSGPQRSYFANMAEAIRVVRQVPAVLTVIPFMAVFAGGLLIAQFYLVQPFLLDHAIPVGWKFSLLQTPALVTGIAGALVAARVVARFGERPTFVGIGLIGVGGFTVMALWDHLAAVAVFAVMGFALASTEPLVAGYIHRRVPSAQRATVLSLFALGMSLMFTPLFFGIGPAVDALGIPWAFGVGAMGMGGLGLASGIVWWRAHTPLPPAAPFAAVVVHVVPPGEAAAGSARPGPDAG